MVADLLEAVTRETLPDGTERIVIDLPRAFAVLHEAKVLKDKETYPDAVNKTIEAVRVALGEKPRQFRLVGPKTRPAGGVGMSGVDPTVFVSEATDG